jgi:uncharacterized membrane protein
MSDEGSRSMIATWVLSAAAAGMLAAALGSFASVCEGNASLTNANVWHGYMRLSAAFGLASLALWCYWTSSIEGRSQASAQDVEDR